MSQSTSLDQLKQFTTVVADTGDFESIRAYEPQDATTNPTLIFKAVQQAEYKPLLDKAIADNRSTSLTGSALHRKVIDDLLIAFGREILSIVPGRVSTEVDARLSFDVEATVEKARYLIGLYEKLGTPRERVLIKIASTWEGAQAAAICAKEGHQLQSHASFLAPAGDRLRRGGRAPDLAFRGTHLTTTIQGQDRQGICRRRGSRCAIGPEHFHLLQKIRLQDPSHGRQLPQHGPNPRTAGSDLLTIAPELLKELKDLEPVTRKLNAEAAAEANIEKIAMDEKTFRWMLNEDAMATDKLAEGIRKFAADIVQLEQIIAKSI
jgi:transaldolase